MEDKRISEYDNLAAAEIQDTDLLEIGRPSIKNFKLTWANLRLAVITFLSDILLGKEDVSNKKTDLTDNSDTFYVSQKAVKTAIDSKQDKGNYLENIVEDTTPELGGNLDAKDKNITGIGSAGFTQELDNGTKTASFTIDFSTDQKQKVTLTANTMTLTLDTTNVKVGNYILKIVNGGLATLTWASESGSIYWVGKTKPTLTSSGTDIIAFYFDGTNWYLVASLNFGTPA